MKNRSLFLFLFLVAFAGFAIESCKHTPFHPLMPVDTSGNGNGGPTDTTHIPPKHSCSPDSVYFMNDVLPIINSNCTQYGCHDSSGHSGDAKPLYSYKQIMNYVIPFQPNVSKLYTDLLQGADDFMPNPPYYPLSSAQDSIIFTWIKQGAFNNQCDGTCDTTNVTYSGRIFPIIQAYCLGCHGGNTGSGIISLTNYQQVAVQANSGSLLGSVTYATGLNGMPVTTRLSDCDINAIRIWIKNGFPNN